MEVNQLNVAGSSKRWPENAVNQDGSPANIVWSEEYECYAVNGVLAPLPLSFRPLEDNEKIPKPIERTPGSPSRANYIWATQQLDGSSNRELSSTRHEPPKITVVDRIVFKLFKFLNVYEEYFLEQHESDTGIIIMLRVVFEKKQTWEVRTSTLTSRNHLAVQPVTEDPNPRIFTKASDLSLQERLVGWTRVKSTRNNGKEDKCYYHQGKKHRSVCEMVTFIIHANRKVKDLRHTADNTTSASEAASPDDQPTV